MAQIRKMRANTGEDEISAIEDAFLLTKATIDRGEIDASIRILLVLYEPDIRQIAVDTKRPMIPWDKRKVMNRHKARNG